MKFRKMQNCSWDSNVMLNVLIAFVRSRELYGTNDELVCLWREKEREIRIIFVAFSFIEHFLIWRMYRRI